MNNALCGSDSWDAQAGTNAVEITHQHNEDAEGREPQSRHSVSNYDNDDKRRGPRRREERGCKSSGWRQLSVMDNKPRQHQAKHSHHRAQRGMAEQYPSTQARAMATEEIIAGQNRDGGNRREDVAGELGLRKGEEENRNECPENQEFRKGIPGPAWGGFAGIKTAQPPLSNRGLNTVDERANGDHRPRHERKNDDSKVVREGLLVLVAVCGKALE